MPNYLIRENLVPGGLGGPKTRSMVLEIPEGADVPEGAIPTDEPARDYQVDPLTEQTIGNA